MGNIKRLKGLFVFDSYKGSMSSLEAGTIVSDEFLKVFPEMERTILEMADGGEGFVASILVAQAGRVVRTEVCNALGERTDSFFGVLESGAAVVEMAAASGLPQLEGRNKPLRADTFGTGELMRAAYGEGCREMFLGIGGSATTDGGTGALRALGVEFLDKDGKAVKRGGEGLIDIVRVDDSRRDALLDECRITIACDVDNPLYGPKGCAYVFAKQKGASAEEIRFLDEGLRNFADVIKRTYGIDLQGQAGSGAAGGIGAGLAAFGKSVTFKRGIDLMLDVSGFDGKAAGCDFVATGAGRTDSQSFDGKVESGVSKRAKSLGVPVLMVSGDVDGDMEEAYKNGTSAAFSTNHVAGPFDKKRSCQDLRMTAKNIAQWTKVVMEFGQ